MKKSYALVLLLVLAAGCAAPPTNTTSTNSTATATPAALVISEADVIAKEKAIWDTIKNKDYETFANMLAENQIEVSPDAVHDKAASIAGVKDFEPTEVTFSDWKYLPIDKDAVVIVYHVNVKGKYKGKEFAPQSVRASSAWVNRNGKWLAAYHQECEVSTAPPPPAATSSPAKTSAPPASTATPITAAADPTSGEKAVWETLKSKNYDGFAAFLAPEAIEVEPNGVFDKAGSVAGVRRIDLSKAQLSEFKSVPFDMDAALVTYQVKLPGPMPAERHSTVWAKRDGKWLAVFHHGTPISSGAVMSTPSPKSATASPSPKPATASPSPR